jgi:ATP-binding cassette subfamily C (CFTR/MRP) protein 1
VDWDTEAIMQTIMEQDFASQTVVSVMHRLRYIERFDRVALLKHGRLVEFDSPQALLARPSEFRSFYHAKQKE